MIDQDAIERRERIFTRLRETLNQFDAITREFVQKETDIDILRKDAREKEKHISHLTRLINVMIKYDCCPVEAQLKYSDEIDINEHDNEANIGYGGKVPYRRGINNASLI